MNLILNRDFKMPDDGWYQFAPLGEFPHAAADVIQVVDAEACIAMASRFKADAAVENFAGLLIDFDHFSLDCGQRSEAAGWVTDLESRPTGLWGQIRWSDVGEEAVKGGRYRFLSPVWARSDCVDLGPNLQSGRDRIRPVRMINAALTNDPNLKGLVPLANSKPVDSGAYSERVHVKVTIMKNVIEKLVNHLGLTADATEAVILEKMAGLPGLSVVADLQNSLTKALGERDALQNRIDLADKEIVAGHLVEFASCITNDNREFWAGQLMTNRTGALAALKDVLRQKTEGGTALTGEEKGRTPLHNRHTARVTPPAGDGSGSPEIESKAVKIRNRAHELVAVEKIPFGAAFRRAEKEIVGQ